MKINETRPVRKSMKESAINNCAFFHLYRFLMVKLNFVKLLISQNFNLFIKNVSQELVITILIDEHDK